MHFNQLAREVWFYELPWFIGWLGFLMEPGWLMLYRNRPVVTISTSSRNDLIRLGFDPTRVTVIPMANRPYAPLSRVSKESAPTVLFVGRLKRSKRVHHAIHAFHRLRRHWPEARLWIVGDGDVNYRKALQRQVERLGLEDAVVFFGAVSEEEKVLRLAQAHLLCVPSVREGWGIVVSEAASQGTPAVVYPVAGLVDSVKDRKTGWICSSPTPRALADAMCELIGHPTHRERLQEGIRREPIVTWDDTASVYWQALRRAGSPSYKSETVAFKDASS
jgi:glycosyltransferase involved in cell wall biosynthesis